MEDKIEFKVNLKSKREEIKTFDDLVNFLKETQKYESNYENARIAVSQAILATAWYFCEFYSMTNCGASFLMWEFIMDWMYPTNKCGLAIIDYDKMLYPQYEHIFKNTILPETWQSIQEEAKESLKNNRCTSLEVMVHWKSITNGIIPFGYSVKEDSLLSVFQK